MVSSTAFISTLARCTSLSSTTNSLIEDISRRALYTCLGVDRSTPYLVSLSAVLFNAPPIPSGAPFPWDASKKFHVASEYFSRRVANRKKFRFCLYWEVGPSLKKWTFSQWRDDLFRSSRILAANVPKWQGGRAALNRRWNKTAKHARLCTGILCVG